jgi:4-amino-4-deoxy-L-arabinose transferase-like glycosyltransferase
MVTGVKRASRARHAALLAALALACLLPFAGKAFHIDDPMYIWAGEQVLADPADFYGFDVNWHGFFEPNYIANKNPPLIGFWLAGVSLLGGWSEPALHVGMLLPLGLLLLSVYGLAARLTASPLGAALALLALPGLLVSATTVMPDVLMLSLWCSASWLWMRGVDDARAGPLVAAGVLMGLAPLAKYFGVALIPLLVAWALARRAPLRLWLPPLALPVAIVGAYEFYMRARYGFSPLLDVAGYALNYAPGRERYAPLARTIVGLTFLGGCTLPVLFAAPWIWARRTCIAIGVSLVAATALAPALGQLGRLQLVGSDGPRWDLALHVAVFGVAGLHLLALGVRDLWLRRDADALLLALWLGGTWFFASFTNWTTTSRSLLPAAPAAALLLVRALEARDATRPLERRAALAVPLALGLLAGLVVAQGDAGLANSARRAARELVQAHGDGSRVVFQGAWGFQLYMQQLGAERLRIDGMQLLPGDLVITPGTNTNLVALPGSALEPVAIAEFPAGRFATTLSKERGAGFYASLWGPLPFVFGPVPAERYRVERVVEPLRLQLRPSPASAPRR